jgi:hypothetical protein
MGTISDKLMRIISTKEDIRKALISKGYDVPTSIPFKEYAKMILDLPCKVDSFPDIEGIVARYSASGLTNEQMATNPVWVDKTGNGHDIQLKNFSWKGMSGVGGVSTYYDKYEFTPDKYYMVTVSSGTQHAQFTFKVTGLVDGNTLSLADTSSPSNLYGKWTQDGIYTVDIDVINTDKSIYFYNGVSAIRGTFTIEILPLYPGALVFDGVDDYGVCENFPILTKEKGYTVVALRQYLVEKSTAYLTANGDSISNTSFIFEGNNYRDTWNFGGVSTIQASRILATQTSKQYDGVKLNIGTNAEGSNLLQVGKWSKSYSNVAIWELVFLDHDATEEELTKIKDYFVKTYPWLFPDQAWTVAGKTNEDEDRATIANITGNGNDLVLSNFGFAEGSGYNEEGEYAGYLVTDGVDDKIISSIFKMGNDWTVIGDWELINTGKNDNAGIVKFDSIVIYNYNSMLINIKNGRNILIPDQNTVNAICSDGRIYSKDWKESIYNEETESTSKNFLTIGYSGNAYTKIAFKNLAIYPTVLSREDCIKAYNYLQTLKSK